MQNTTTIFETKLTSDYLTQRKQTKGERNQTQVSEVFVVVVILIRVGNSRDS
jgi:hypothetical protein